MIDGLQAKQELMFLINVEGTYLDGYKNGVRDAKDEAIMQIRRIDSDLRIKN